MDIRTTSQPLAHHSAERLRDRIARDGIDRVCAATGLHRRTLVHAAAGMPCLAATRKLIELKLDEAAHAA